MLLFYTPSPTFGLAKAPAFIFKLDNNEHYSSFANVSMEFFLNVSREHPEQPMNVEIYPNQEKIARALKDKRAYP